VCAPSRCRGCAQSLAGAAAAGVRRLQEFNISPPPPPRVTVIRSYLSTAAEWGISKLDALGQLFTTGPWLPPAIAPL